jgi:hypothetical protein
MVPGCWTPDHKEVDSYQHLRYGPVEVIATRQKERLMLIAADRKPRHTLVAGAGLIAAMAVGSLVMWIGVPLGLIWFASHLQTGAEPSMGPYLVVGIGRPTLLIPQGKALASLDRAFSRISGHTPQNRRGRLPWLQSVRGERGPRHRATVLDALMIASVAIASAGFLCWFLFLAGSSLPAS